MISANNSPERPLTLATTTRRAASVVTPIDQVDTRSQYPVAVPGS
jgi:hypothetical protein